MMLALWALSSGLWAQPAPSMPGAVSGMDSPRTQRVVQPDTDSSSEGSDVPSAPAPTAMSLADARLNFGTVVESFIAARSRKGYWPLKQKSTGKTLRLKFVEVGPKTVREIQPGHFAARVLLHDLDKDQPIKADFYVDFSGRQWAVERLRLVPASSGKEPPPDDGEAPAGQEPSEPAPAAEASEAPSSPSAPEPTDESGEAPKAPKAGAVMPGMIGPAVKKVEPPPTAFPPTTQP